MDRLIDTFKQTADRIAFLDRGRGISAPDVQSAIEEVKKQLDSAAQDGFDYNIVEFIMTPPRKSHSPVNKSYVDIHPGRVHLVAHRGACYAPENTIAALTLLPPECTGVEADIQVTSDGVPIMMHDSTVDRTTNGSGNVSSMTLSQIKQLDAGYWFSPEFEGVRVPTLEEYLDACKRLNISMVFLDIKDFSVIQTIKSIISNASMEENCIITVRGKSQMALWRSVDLDSRLATFGGAVSTIEDRISGCLEYGGEVIFISPGDSAYENNRSVVPQIRAAGIIAGGSTINEPSLIQSAISEDGLQIVMSDNVNALVHFKGGRG